MKKPITGATEIQLLFWAVLFLVALVQCDDALPTANPVTTIELAGLDKILGDKEFSGLATIIASWCPPCREELPDLAKLHRKYQDREINIIAISIDEGGPADVQPLINKLKIPFPVYWVGTKAIKKYKIVGVPTLLVVRNGEILETVPGLHPRSVLESKIQKLMN